MPKSKRDRLITLAATRPHGKELKQQVACVAQDGVDEYERLFVVRLVNERNSLLKSLRETWKGSGRFLFAKNRVIARALDGYHPGLKGVAKGLSSSAGALGRKGLFFTNSPVQDVVSFFQSFAFDEFSRAGAKATREVVLAAGPLEGFAFSLEPTLRQLGLKTKLNKGVVELIEEHVVCKKGQVLSPEQCRLLVSFSLLKSYPLETLG